MCTHTTKIPVDIPVGESQNLQPKRHQELRTFRIISKPLRFIMLRAIQFNDQSGRSIVYPLRPRCARPPLPKGEARDARTVHRKVYRSAPFISSANWSLLLDTVVFECFIFSNKAKAYLFQHMLTPGIFPDGICIYRSHSQLVKGGFSPPNVLPAFRIPFPSPRRFAYGYSRNILFYHGRSASIAIPRSPYLQA